MMTPMMFLTMTIDGEENGDKSKKKQEKKVNPHFSIPTSAKQKRISKRIVLVGLFETTRG